MIKGLMPQLAEAGKIKLGGLGAERTSKGGGKYRAPVKYTSFCVTTTHRDSKGDLEVDDTLMQALPHDADGKVRAIPILLHSDDIDAVFPTSYACYAGKSLFCLGDGEKAERWDDTRTGKITVECPCPYLGARTGPVCKPHGTLHCSINVKGKAIAGAVHKWRTTSIISIQRMVGSLQQILATVGVLRGVPLWLKVSPINVAPEGKASTVYCCHLELRASDVMDVQREALEAAKVRRAMGNTDDIDAAYRLLVAAPGRNETPEEQAEVAAEFHAEMPPIEPDDRVKRLSEKLRGRQD